ncbi:hypothetical protein HAX54_043705 [Datura stramonium]|uniref:RRM domain-containing protein n=1 Tax=Datura stramonium TaxID=4076 RepID=A0ABS8W4T9_DATST|nr:hypothetical protein [Datura stramonium]
MMYGLQAKSYKSLWVAGISKYVSKEELEDQFKKFGKIQEYKLIRDRNAAYVEFARKEDAAEALKNMNRKKIGSKHIHVDYFRSQPMKKEKGPEFREMRDGQYPNRSISHPDTRLMPQDSVMSNSMDVGFSRKHPILLPVGQRADGQLSKVLCISYPPSVHVDKFMLYNAMILFGEIDEIKVFHDENFSLVQFRSVEEAQCAKERLQGKLFNDRRIKIEYSNSGPTPGTDFLAYHPSITGPTNFYSNEDLSQPAPMGIVCHNRHSSRNCIWRGIIAKTGLFVCRAECFTAEERIEFEIPDIVNCSARMGLDMLTEYCTNAIGFNIVYFLPDPGEDFASFTKFLRYLISKDRAGVAEFGDGTTLFLVPPSDFLTKVLNISGQQRLYGVVVKFASHIPSGPFLPPESHQPQYVDAPQITSSQISYDAMSFMESVSEMNNNQVTQEDLKLSSREYDSLNDAYPTNLAQPGNIASYPVNSVHQSNIVELTQTGICLPTDLIETLTKMLPANKLSSMEGTTVPAEAFASIPASDVVIEPGILQQQPSRYEQEAPAQVVDHMVQFGSQFNNQTQILSQLQSQSQVLNMPNYYFQGSNSFSQIQENNLNLQPQGGPPQTLTSTIISQGTQHSVQPYVDRQLQFGRYQDVASGSGIDYGTDALRNYGSLFPQQPTNH